MGEKSPKRRKTMNKLEKAIMNIINDDYKHQKLTGRYSLYEFLKYEGYPTSDINISLDNLIDQGYIKSLFDCRDECYLPNQGEDTMIEELRESLLGLARLIENTAESTREISQQIKEVVAYIKETP